MKNNRFFISAIITILFGTMIVFSSCSNTKNEDTIGFVTFGANYHIVNCITTVSIYIDGEFIGKLENYTNEITDCDQSGNITKEINTGDHAYKIEIRPINTGGGCNKDIEGIFTIAENECKKIFIDYSNIVF